MSDVVAGRKAGTAEGLLEFLGYTIEKGLLKRPTAGAMKSAVREVLSSVEAEGWQALDMHQLDTEDMLRRFENTRSMDYTPGSLTTYGGRFRKAVSMYLDFLSAPGAWRPAIRERTRSAPGTRSDSADGAPPPAARSQANAPATVPTPAPETAGPAGASLVTYPFPVRPGVLATFQLPRDLSRAEARRMAAFLESLTIEGSDAGRFDSTGG